MLLRLVDTGRPIREAFGCMNESPHRDYLYTATTLEGHVALDRALPWIGRVGQ